MSTTTTNSNSTKSPVPLGIRKRVSSASPSSSTTATAASSSSTKPLGLMRKATTSNNTTNRNTTTSPSSASTSILLSPPSSSLLSRNTNSTTTTTTTKQTTSPSTSGRLTLQPMNIENLTSSSTSHSTTRVDHEKKKSGDVTTKNNHHKNNSTTTNHHHNTKQNNNSNEDEEIETVIIGSSVTTDQPSSPNNLPKYGIHNKISPSSSSSPAREFSNDLGVSSSSPQNNNNNGNENNKNTHSPSELAKIMNNNNTSRQPLLNNSNHSALNATTSPLLLSGQSSPHSPGSPTNHHNNTTTRVRSSSVTNLLSRGGGGNNNNNISSSPRQIRSAIGRNNTNSNENSGGGTKVAGTAVAQMKELYEVDLANVIGEGAYGTVCRGICRQTGELVAVKNLNKQKVGARNLMACLGEVETMTLLNHEYIVRLLDVFQDEMSMLIIMEFIGHGPLTDFVTKHGSLPESTVKRVTLNLLMALEHMHEKGIVHRDLKPANCLISSIDYRPSENVATAVANRRARGWSLLRQNKSTLRASSVASSLQGLGQATHNNNGSAGAYSSPTPNSAAITMANSNNNNGNNNNALGLPPPAPSASSPKSGFISPVVLNHNNNNHGIGGNQGLNKSIGSDKSNNSGTPRELGSTQYNVFGNNTTANNNNNNNNTNNIIKNLTHSTLSNNGSFDLTNNSLAYKDSPNHRATNPNVGNNPNAATTISGTYSLPSPTNELREEERGDPILGVKICDFGFAIMVGGGSCLTNFCGTPSYMAPEITLAESTRTPYGKPVDIWSLGVMVYWLACSRMPFSKAALHECTAKALAPKFDEAEWRHFSPEGKEFIKKLLCFDAKERITAKVALSDVWITSSTELSEADSKREALIERLADKADREGDDAAYRELQEIEEAKKKKMSQRKIHSLKAAASIVVAAHRLIFFSSIRRLVRHGCSNELIHAVNSGLMSFFLGGDYDPPSHAIRARRLLRRPMTPPPATQTSKNGNGSNGNNNHPQTSRTTTTSPPPNSNSNSTNNTNSSSNELSNHACDFVCTLLENAPKVTHFDVADNGIESLDAVQRIVRAAQGHRNLVELSLAENPLHPLAGRTLLRFARSAVSPQLTKVDVHGCSNLANDIGPSVSAAIKERIEQLRASNINNNNNNNENLAATMMSNISPSTAYLQQMNQKEQNSNNNNENSNGMRIRRRSASAASNNNNRLMSAGGGGGTRTASEQQAIDEKIFGNSSSSNHNHNNNRSSTNPSSKIEWSLEYSIMRHLRAANPSRGIFAETISSANRRSASSGGGGGLMNFSTSYQLPPLRASTPSIPSSSTPLMNNNNNNTSSSNLPPRSNSTLPPSNNNTNGLPPRGMMNNSNNSNNSSSASPPTGSPTTRHLLVGMNHQQQHNHTTNNGNTNNSLRRR